MGGHRWIVGLPAREFHQVVDALVEGREIEYFRSFIDRFAVHREAITDDDIAIYARRYRTVEQLAAGPAHGRSSQADDES